MFSVHPKLAKEFAAKTKSIAALPEHSGDKKKDKKPVIPKRA